MEVVLTAFADTREVGIVVVDVRSFFLKQLNDGQGRRFPQIVDRPVAPQGSGAAAEHQGQAVALQDPPIRYRATLPQLVASGSVSRRKLGILALGFGRLGLPILSVKSATLPVGFQILSPNS